ncbi:MAG: DJ-1/PfpI family protein [Cyclobacteriaceae bacterium]
MMTRRKFGEVLAMGAASLLSLSWLGFVKSNIKTKKMKRNVAILIFDDAEVLDFAGPFEVFSVASEVHNYELFNVFTVAKTMDKIIARNGLSVNPDFDFINVPKIDILIISGGSGSSAILEERETLDWVELIHQSTEHTLSICSGARVLGKLGLLDDQPYCTHHGVYDHMKEIVPSGLPQPKKRYVQSGKIFTSGGISAGIDLSFHVLLQLHGRQVVDNTAGYMEYRLETS